MLHYTYSFIHLFIYLFIYFFIYLFFYSFIYLFIYSYQFVPSGLVLQSRGPRNSTGIQKKVCILFSFHLIFFPFLIFALRHFSRLMVAWVITVFISFISPPPSIPSPIPFTPCPFNIRATYPSYPLSFLPFPTLSLLPFLSLTLFPFLPSIQPSFLPLTLCLIIPSSLPPSHLTPPLHPSTPCTF